MKWMKERDLMIAQTMAFVQSVTGKAPDAARTVTATPAALPSVETCEPSARETAVLTLPDIAPLSDQAPPVPETPAIVQAPVTGDAAVEVAMETSRQGLRLAPLTRPDLLEDFQSEIRARVANFRAHQERFNREREAYCTATMARVHATLKQSELPPLRPGK
jgi:hypothetical protein